MTAYTIEDLRPRTLDDILGQDDVVRALKRLAERATSFKPPHLIFWGPPGTGKSSATKAFVSAVTGMDPRATHHDRYMEVNASKDRGLETIRQTVIPFITGHGGGWGGKDLKFLRLAEADHLTQEAQAALREPMEAQSRWTVMILECNDLAKIDVAIQSRCHRCEFHLLTSSQLRTVIERGAAALGLPLDSLDLTGAIKYAKGAPRDALQYIAGDLQMASDPGRSPAEKRTSLGGRPKVEIDIEEAFRLRLAGKSWTEIVDAMGLPRAQISTVRRRVSERTGKGSDTG